MNNYKYYLVFAVLLFNTNCDSDQPPEISDDSIKIYSVVTIENLSLNEFEEKIGSCDYPLEIRIDYQDSLYEGSVLFKKIGNKKIENTCLEKRCFIVNCENELEEITFIVFNNIEITDSYLNGSFSCGSPTGDYPSHNFKAIKK